MNPDLTPRQRMAHVVLGLRRVGTVSKRDLAKDLCLPPGRVAADLKELESCGLAERLGSGRETRWRLVESEPVQRRHRGLIDQLALHLGREHLDFLGHVDLTEPYRRHADDPDLQQPLRATGRVDQKFHVIHEPARRYDDHGEILDDLLEAVVKERCVSFEFREDGRERVVQPLTIVLYRRGVYLIGRSEGHERIFAVDQMGALSLGEPFDYPADWSPRGHFRECFGVFASGPVREILLAFSREKERYLRPRDWHPSARFEDLPDGRLGLRLRLRGREITRWILEWGEHVEVLEPKVLREEIRGVLSEALGGYGGDEGEP